MVEARGSGERQDRLADILPSFVEKARALSSDELKSLSSGAILDLAEVILRLAVSSRIILEREPGHWLAKMLGDLAFEIDEKIREIHFEMKIAKEDRP